PECFIPMTQSCRCCPGCHGQTVAYRRRVSRSGLASLIAALAYVFLRCTSTRLCLPSGVLTHVFCLCLPICLRARVTCGLRLRGATYHGLLSFSDSSPNGIGDGEVALNETLRYRTEQGSDPGQDNGSSHHRADAHQRARPPTNKDIFK